MISMQEAYQETKPQIQPIIIFLTPSWYILYSSNTWESVF